MIVVQLATIEEFIGELRGATIVDKTVRWSVRRSAEQKEGATFGVSVWATAILRCEDADYLLEFGKAMGSSESKDSPVEVKTHGLESNLKAACQEIGLAVRPGKIEVF